MLAVLEELEMDIAAMDPCDEREELERTRDFCQDMSYLVEEGFITAEHMEDGTLRFFPV